MQFFSLLVTCPPLLKSLLRNATAISKKIPEQLLLFAATNPENYSSLIVGFSLRREIGHYLLDYFVPTILLVVMSWVSFWLHPSAVPGRTTLGESSYNYFAEYFVSFSSKEGNEVFFFIAAKVSRSFRYDWSVAFAEKGDPFIGLSFLFLSENMGKERSS